MLALVLAAAVSGPNYLPPERTWERLLGSEVFDVREGATRELIRTGDIRLIIRLHFSKDCEVRYRARQAYDSVKAGVLNSLEPYPFLDSLWYNPTLNTYSSDHPNALKLHPYLFRVWGLCEIPDFGGYRQATRIWFGDLYDEGVPVQLLKPLLWEMRRKDRIYLSTFHK
jgi:hypothetical protein